MDGLQLRDEAVRDRIRSAEEFLDPSELTSSSITRNTDYFRRCTSPRVGLSALNLIPPKQLTASQLPCGNYPHAQSRLTETHRTWPVTIIKTKTLMVDQVSLDEIRAHSRALAEGYAVPDKRTAGSSILNYRQTAADTVRLRSGLRSSAEEHHHHATKPTSQGNLG